MVLEISKQKTLWFQMNGRRGPSIHTHSENSGQLGPPDPVVGIQLLPALALPGGAGGTAHSWETLLCRGVWFWR